MVNLPGIDLCFAVFSHPKVASNGAAGTDVCWVTKGQGPGTRRVCVTHAPSLEIPPTTASLDDDVNLPTQYHTISDLVLSNSLSFLLNYLRIFFHPGHPVANLWLQFSSWHVVLFHCPHPCEWISPKLGTQCTAHQAGRMHHWTDNVTDEPKTNTGHMGPS